MSQALSTLIDYVLPVHNEAHVLAGSVERLAAAAERLEGPWRIVIAENGSTDGTAAVAESLAQEYPFVRVRRMERPGRGRALRSVWLESDAEYSVYMDVDLSTELSALPAALRLLREGADVVAGSRLHHDARIHRSLKREVLSRGYNRLVHLLLRTRGFDDAQCGFKAVRLDAVRPILPLIRNGQWFFDTELLVLAEYAGLSVRNLPVVWGEDPDTRVRIVKTVWEELSGVVRLRWTARTTLQGAALEYRRQTVTTA